MFNFIFPIFCFGLVITGIVFLGLIEAAKQMKAESGHEREPETPNAKRNPVSPRFTPRSSRD